MTAATTLGAIQEGGGREPVEHLLLDRERLALAALVGDLVRAGAVPATAALRSDLVVVVDEHRRDRQLTLVERRGVGLHARDATTRTVLLPMAMEAYRLSARGEERTI